MQHISVGDLGGVWGTTTDADVFMIKNGKAVTVDGKMRQIDAGEYRVVGVNNWGDVFYRDGVTEQNPAGGKWLQIEGALVMVTTSGTAVTWGVDRESQLWFLEDGGDDKIPETEQEKRLEFWELVPTASANIAP